MQDIFSRLDALCAKMTEDAFLHNKGLSNEVGFFVFSYHPDEEMTVRHFLQVLPEKAETDHLPCRILLYDLYQILLDICQERRILDRIWRSSVAPSLC